MKKKVLAFAAATVLAATAVGGLAGCGGGSSNTINVLLLANSHEEIFYREYFEEMEETLKEEGLDYTITFSGYQEANYYNTLKAAIQGGETPDIFYIRPNELLQYKTQIASLEEFAQAHGFTENEEERYANLKDIYENALNMYRFNPDTGAIGNKGDELYAFPKDLSTQQLGYNKQLVEKFEPQIVAAGLRVPWKMDFTKENYSWAQFKKLCDTIAKAIKDTGATNTYTCDVPPIEVLAKSYGVDLIDFSNGRGSAVVTSPATNEGLKNAIKFQSEFIASGAGDYENATYSNFSAGRVCFYGAVGSWEIADYNTLLNKDANGNATEEEQWGVMPWPTVDGSTKWYGLITSAGYVVSKDCARSEKGEVAMRLAMSFLSDDTQERLVKEEKISLPLRESVRADYLNKDNDKVYSPSTRSVFMDVIDGSHGITPAKYKTYDENWSKELDQALVVIWQAKGSAVSTCESTNWQEVATRMQQQYDATKDD